MVNEIKAYNGNPLLKPIGTPISFTAEQVVETEKCRTDPIYFIEKYCKIVTLDHGLVEFKLYDVQKELVHLILNNRKVVAMQPRQTGKSTVSAAVFVWLTLFTESYTVAILANKGAAAREVLDRYQIMYENLPIWLQQGVSTWNKGDVELENGSKVFTAATSASGIRGKTCNMLYVDEAAIIANTVAEQFFASVYPVISSGTSTKILLTSTPLGYNHFWKIWTEAESGKNGFLTKHIHYYDIPGRDEAWADEQRKTLGEIKFNQEVLCQFLGSSHTLISGQALASMATETPIFARDDATLQVYREPDPASSYVVVVDTSRGIGGDYSVATVIDVTSNPYFLVAKYRSNTISPMLLPDVVWKLAKDYNEAYILVENNDVGAQVVDIIHVDLEYENIFTTTSENGKAFVTVGFSKGADRGVRMTKSVKRIGAIAIKNIIEEKKLLVTDADAIFEMSTFIQKAASWQADDGYHDDIMMTLLLFGWLTTNTYFKELTNVDIRQRLYNQQMADIADELTPFGFIDNGSEEEAFVDHNVVWSSSPTGFPSSWSST